MTLFTLSGGERINLDNVTRIISRQGAVELYFTHGSPKVVTLDEDIDRLNSALSTQEKM
jgi:hypothetical protein